MKNTLTSDARNMALQILSEHRLMALATNRSDGWPQVTTVGYVNEGLVLYCFVSRVSQKYMNIARDPRVSLCVAGDFADPHEIRGLSLAGLAEPVREKQDYLKFWDLFRNRCPEYAGWPNPNAALAPLLRITPTVMSVIDYRDEFGHSDSFALPAHSLGQSNATTA